MQFHSVDEIKVYQHEREYQLQLSLARLACDEKQKCSCNLCWIYVKERKKKFATSSLATSDALFQHHFDGNASNEDKSTRHFMLWCAALSINLNTLLMLIEASLLAGAIKISPSCAHEAKTWSEAINNDVDNERTNEREGEIVFKESQRTCCYHLLFFDFCLVKGVNIFSTSSCTLSHYVRCDLWILN